jgi:glycosyltransferase involved in cell wall biosynthesis
VPASIDVDGAYARSAPAVATLLHAADLVTVSTEELAERYRPLVRRVEVVANAVDEALWLSHGAFAPRRTALSGGPIRAVYMGQATHHDEFAFLSKVAVSLADDGVEITVLGPELPEVPHIRAIASPARSYPDFVGWFRSLACEFDVALGPLLDTPFNRAKSALKFLDYSAVGLPGIYSRVGPFTEAVEDGKSGLLVDNTISAWRDALLLLKNDDRLREELGERAAQSIRERHLLRPSLPRWDGLVRGLASSRAGTP